MLSDNALDTLAAATQFAYGVGDAQRRTNAREAVKAAAAELDLDPLAPSLPRFAAGEDVLRAAALRVLTVPGLDKALEKHRARVAACDAAADRIAELEGRRHELGRIELGRMDDQIKAGKVPGPPPADAIAELQALEAQLALVGSGGVSHASASERIRAWVRADERPLIVEAIRDRQVFASVILYGLLVAERLRVLTEDEHYKSPAARTAQRAAAEVRGLVKSFNLRREDAELDRTARAVAAAVELADLHLLHERQQLSVEQLEAASTAPASR
jgi:hypothetical protein